MGKINNQWAIRDAGTIMFKDVETYDIKAIVKSSKTFELNTTSTVVYARGGYGNPKLVSFKGGKETTVTATSALFDNNLLALQLGSDTTSGEYVIPVNSDVSKAVTDASNVSVTPSYAVKDGKFYSVVQLGNNGLTVAKSFELNAEAATSAELGADEYAVVGGKVLLPLSELGSTIGLYYDGLVTDAVKIENKSTSFAGEYRVEVEVIAKDAMTSKEYSGLLIFPKVAMTDEITLSLSADGDPSVQNIGFDVLQIPGDDVQYQLIIFDKNNIATEGTSI